MQYDKIAHKNTNIITNGPSETKPDAENYKIKNYSSKCAYDCAQCTINCILLIDVHYLHVDQRRNKCIAIEYY